MADKNKEELSNSINRSLFGSEDVLDFSRMKKVDLAILESKLGSDEAVNIALRLARNQGVGRGWLIDKIEKTMIGEESPVGKLLRSEEEE